MSKKYREENNSPRSAKSHESFSAMRDSRVVLEGDVSGIDRALFPRTVVYNVFLSVMGIVIIVACVILIGYVMDRIASIGKYDEIAASYTNQVDLPRVEDQDPDTSAWPPQVDFAALKAENEDVVGWIRIPGTDIDYPVMANEDRDYYLHRDMYGDYSVSGSIFLDYENSRDPDSEGHIVIYGHHMRLSTMFHSVADYSDPEFFDEHSLIYFETPNNVYVLHPIGTYVAHASEYEARQVLFNTEQEFQSYIDERIERCDEIRFDGYNRQTMDKLITLITCTSTGNNRQVVECVPVQVYPTSMIQLVIDRLLAEQHAQ